MGMFDKFFRKETKEEIKAKEKIEQMQKQGIDVQAPLIENKILCNACGKEITDTPRFLNCNGRKMIFHKKCLKKLRKGQVQF